MKHFFAVLLSMLLLFSVPACGEDALAISGTPPVDTEAAGSQLPEPQVNAAPEIPADAAIVPQTSDVPATPPDPSNGQVSSPEDTAPVQETEENEAAPTRVIDPEKPMVALTFDDGPHATLTDQLLDILEENDAVATFFQVAQNLWKDPDAVRRAEAMGCEIGNHSYRHANLSKLSADEIAADLQKADNAFIEVLSHAPTLLRPPYGSMNSAVKTTTGRSIITWSIDTEDWRSRNAEKVIASVQGAGNLDGQVILMHDVHASTIEAAKTLIPWLIDQGYQLVTITELITLHYGDQVLPNGVYGYSYFKFGKPVLLPEGQTVPQPTSPSSDSTSNADDPAGGADSGAAQSPSSGETPSIPSNPTGQADASHPDSPAESTLPPYDSSNNGSGSIDQPFPDGTHRL